MIDSTNIDLLKAFRDDIRKEYERKKRFIEMFETRNGIRWIKKRLKTYKGIDLTTYDGFFRGQRGTYKKKKYTYENKFIYGVQINEYRYDEVVGHLINDNENIWRLYGVREETLGLSAPIHGYKKKKGKNRYTKIYLFEGDVVRVKSENKIRNGVIDHIHIINGEFCICNIPIIKFKDDMLVVIDNEAGIDIKITDILRADDK